MLNSDPLITIKASQNFKTALFPRLEKVIEFYGNISTLTYIQFIVSSDKAKPNDICTV